MDFSVLSFVLGVLFGMAVGGFVGYILGQRWPFRVGSLNPPEGSRTEIVQGRPPSAASKHAHPRASSPPGSEGSILHELLAPKLEPWQPDQQSADGEPTPAEGRIDGSAAAGHHLADRPELAAIEESCREFLVISAERDIDTNEAIDWFRRIGFIADVKEPLGSAWGLLSVGQTRGQESSGQRVVLIPVMHRAMGQVPLSEYYEFASYNGLDPLTPENVRSFCLCEPLNGIVQRRGLIDGR